MSKLHDPPYERYDPRFEAARLFDIFAQKSKNNADENEHDSENAAPTENDSGSESKSDDKAGPDERPELVGFDTESHSPSLPPQNENPHSVEEFQSYANI